MPAVNLTPLGLGELLDQTFSYFRKHFWLFAGIMVIPEGLLVALQIIVQVSIAGISYSVRPQSPQAAAAAGAAALRAGLASLGTLIPYFIVYALALGATTYALSEVYMGRSVTIRQAYRAVMRRFWRLAGVVISIALRTFGVFLLAMFVIGFTFAGVGLLPKSVAWLAIISALLAILAMLATAVLVLFFLLRYSVAVPAVIIENINSRQALKRSVGLTQGFLGRLLVVAILMSLIRLVVVALCGAPFAVGTWITVFKGGHPSLWLTIPQILVGGAAGTATAPLLMISFAIAYYDLRVRKEGFDLQVMMSYIDELSGQIPQSAGYGAQADAFEDASVLATVLLTWLTAGIYQPIWFLTRRRAFNSLNSREKIGVVGLIAAMVAFVGNFLIPITGSFVWGSAVQAENVLGPLHPAVVLVAGIIMVVYAFKARRILLDHLAPPTDGMFAASVRFQYDEMLSRMGTFFLGIFYLQYKINGLLDQLTHGETTTPEFVSVAPADSLPPLT